MKSSCNPKLLYGAAGFGLAVGTMIALRFTAPQLWAYVFVLPSVPPMPPLAEMLCANAADDDRDGLIDMADPDCGMSAGSAAMRPPVEMNCSNGTDDDADLLVNMADSDCSGMVTSSAAVQVIREDCTNGIDDDGDSLVDMEDSDC